MGLTADRRVQQAAGGNTYLQEMCVRPEDRYKGIGGMIPNHPQAEFLRMGVVRVFLKERGVPAEAFYRKHGFRKADGMVAPEKRVRANRCLP